MIGSTLVPANTSTDTDWRRPGKQQQALPDPAWPQFQVLEVQVDIPHYDNHPSHYDSGGCHYSSWAAGRCTSALLVPNYKGS
jgi:hypothetical protein